LVCSYHECGEERTKKKYLLWSIVIPNNSRGELEREE
jgi:hypothetical protein